MLSPPADAVIVLFDVSVLTSAVPPTVRPFVTDALSAFTSPEKVPVVPLIAPLLTSALTVAVPELCRLVTVAVVPLIAPLLTNSLTVAVPPTCSVLLSVAVWPLIEVFDTSV